MILFPLAVTVLTGMRVSSQVEFTGWQNIGLEDLVVAYRKAKADCFFENTFPTAIKFAEYEQDLLANLKTLLANLQADKGFSDNDDYLGETRHIHEKAVVVNAGWHRLLLVDQQGYQLERWFRVF